jgi:hypothetical protein
LKYARNNKERLRLLGNKEGRGKREEGRGKRNESIALQYKYSIV